MRTSSTLAPWIVIVMLVATTRGADATPGAIIIPPLEVDLGALDPIGDAPALAGPATELFVGVHWASLAWKPKNRLEVGVGYVGSFRPLAPGFKEKRSELRLDDELHLNGMYMTLGTTLVRQKYLRAWMSARGELMRTAGMGNNVSVSGAAFRIATELYVSGMNGFGDSSAAIGGIGTFAIGVYVEASYRDLPSEFGSGGLATGLSVRVPFMVAVAK